MPNYQTQQTPQQPDSPVKPLQVGEGLLAVLFLIGCVAAFAKTLISKQPVSRKECAGRVLIGGILSLSAAATPMIFTAASPEVQCGVAACLAIVGDAMAVNWLKKRLGV